jgi:hypothetical protein
MACSSNIRMQIDVHSSSTHPFSTHRITPLAHRFHEHPLMHIQQLAALAHELAPLKSCRFVLPEIREDSAFFHQAAHPEGRQIDDVFERIEEPGSWLALYNIEQIPRYRAFLDEVMNAVRPWIERTQAGVFNVGGFMFISAPPSVTPFHIDRENNFWLQIKGRKTISVWNHTDRSVVAQRDVENFIVHRDLGKVRLPEAARARAVEFHAQAGEGIYFPATSPHMTRTTNEWVKAGDGVSISLGVVFYTSLTRHHARVHQCNRMLRQLGLQPLAPGVSAWRDALKAPLGRTLCAYRVRFKGHDAPPGSY